MTRGGGSASSSCSATMKSPENVKFTFGTFGGRELREAHSVVVVVEDVRVGEWRRKRENDN